MICVRIFVTLCLALVLMSQSVNGDRDSCGKEVAVCVKVLGL